MSNEISAHALREALISALPTGTSHGEAPALGSVYLPRSHLKALHPDALLVSGMRGAGKTFWWSALQDPAVRQLLAEGGGESPWCDAIEVQIGFGVRPEPTRYPGPDVLRNLMDQFDDARAIWRSVQAYQLAAHDHPLRRAADWEARVRYVRDDPEPIERLFYECDRDLDRAGRWSLILFDALDRCADDWTGMYRLIRGLLQSALDMRSYRRLRVKVFLRSDQLDEAQIADFPDASKVLASRVELAWPRHELYGLLWHSLGNASKGGEAFRQLSSDFAGKGQWAQVVVDGSRLFGVPRELISDAERQRRLFHAIAGNWMGRDRRRGFPYTWVPNHLADAEERVSPRSFVVALRKAADDTQDRYPEHGEALHYESIKRGVQEASKVRVQELQEDYPWVHRLLQPLQGMVVPCGFDEVIQRWESDDVLDRLGDDIAQNEVKLPPAHFDRGDVGIRQDLESLGIFLRTRDGRVNIPDVFRVGYGLGRRGGVKPVGHE